MDEQLELPNTSLPFLVYQFFKPKAYKWDKIKNVSEIEVIDNPDIYIEKIVPLKINKNKGYLIYFNEEYSKEAYEYISNHESEKFEWKSMKIDGGGPEVNLLIQKPYHHYLFPRGFNFRLPFFAYGIFKPGQIAFSNISPFVKSFKKAKINRNIILMDAMALLSKRMTRNSSNGYLIYFKEENAQNAYKIVSKTKPKNIYKWEVLDVKGVYANVLVGNHPKMDSPFSKFIKNYTGAKDPFFRNAINLIGKEKEKIEFFKLQMNYLLLWASIERFCVLKYGEKTSSKNNERFAEEKMFKKYIKDKFKNIDKKKLADERSVFSPKKFKDVNFDLDDCKQIIDYYYAIRCNVAHRGKAANELNTVMFSLNELLNIFRCILNDTFNITTIEGIDFYLPYGFKVYTDEIINDIAVKTFKKDENILIGGIPDYEIKIMVQENNELDEKYVRNRGIFEENSYKFVENNKLVEIEINTDDLYDVINEFFI